MDGLKIAEIEVTLDALANVIETAIDAGHTHGIGYWARVEKIKQTEFAGERGKQRIGWVNLFDHQGAGETDSSDDSAYRQQRKLYPETKPGFVGINTENIKRAIAKILADPEGTDSADAAGRIIGGEYPDGPLADVIVQVACFGKVIYG